MVSFSDIEAVDAVHALMSEPESAAKGGEEGGSATAGAVEAAVEVTWEEHEAQAEARKAEFVKHFKLTEKEVAFMKKQSGTGGNSEWASLEAALLSKVATQLVDKC